MQWDGDLMATNFGKDIACLRGLKTGRYARGFELVAQSYYLRLTTPRGMLRGGEEEENFGLNLIGLVGTSPSPSIAAKIENELRKDERTLSVVADVVATVEGPATVLTITITAETTEGPFTLQLSATDVSVEILGVAA
jgi:phage baseplate assembly protein W